ncbi:ParA family protein [Burkholderia pseudomallei]|uniref:ParA family protein n=1 Tax=Burkholderia pseudomallei TaxID=28450 RepID=UPI0009E2F2A8|nr:ParA family protein [Burkholderia pseudomallei]
MASKQTPKPAPVVATINMKGGVGKTTITAHVLRLLYYRLQKRVLLIDLDPQFNLTQTILPETNYERVKVQQKTILSVLEPKADPSLYTISSTPAPAPNVEDIAVLMKFTNKTENRLDLIPGDFGLVKYTLMNDEKSLIPIRQRLLSFIEQCREKYDLICIDCNPSSSFLTQCGIFAASHLLVPVRPDRYSILGLELLDQFVENMASLPKKPEKIIILNGIPTKNYDPSVENTLRSSPKFGTKTLSNFLTITKLLEASPSYTGFATDRRVAHRAKLTKRIEAVVDELGQVLGLI